MEDEVMTTFWFSPTTCTFYDGDFMDSYKANGDWPEDAYEVPVETFLEYTSETPTDKVLGSVDGKPAWVDNVMDAEAQGVWASLQREKALRSVMADIQLYTAKAALGALTEDEKTELSRLVMMYEALKGE